MIIIETIFPVFAIVILGYVLRRKNILNDAEGQAIEKVSFSYLVPCLLFFGTATVEFPNPFDWELVISFYLSVLIIYLLAMFSAKIVFPYNTVELSVFGMGSAYSNISIIGIPLCLQLFGEEAFVPLFVIISIHNLILFSFGIIVAESKNNSSLSLVQHLFFIIKDILKGPITGCLIAGVLVNLSGIEFYAPLYNSLNLISQAAIPMALLSLGSALTRYQIRGEINATIIIVTLKLLVLPALVWFFSFHVFDINPLWAATAVIMAATPVGISPYIFCIKYRALESQIASSIVISAIFSIFTITLITIAIT